MIERVRGQRLAAVALLAIAITLSIQIPGASAKEAAGFGEYQARVESALEMVEEAGAEVLDEEKAQSLSAQISTLLPAVEEIETDSGTARVDNSILRTLSSRLAAADSTSERARVLAEMRNHLESMNVAVAGDPELIPSDPEALEALLGSQHVSTRSPFTELIGRIVERILIFIQNWWEAVGANSGASRTATYVTYGFIAALVLGLGFILVRAGRRMLASRAKPEGEIPFPQAPVAPKSEPIPEDPLGAADKLAAEGSRTAAVRILLASSAHMLAKAGLIRRPKTRTNGELLRQVRSRPEIGEPLSGLANLFDRAFFGHREPDPEAYAAARGWYERLRGVLAARGEDAK